MTDDLVQRLKGHSEIMERDKGKFVRFIDVATCTEAAERIEALTAENERLQRSADSWEADASRYAQNAEYWKAEVEKYKIALGGTIIWETP